jgi:hypothetical protein
VVEQSPTGETNGFADRLLRQALPPLRDRLPAVLGYDVAEDVGHEHSRPAEGEPPVADARVGHHVLSQLGDLARVALASLVERLLHVLKQRLTRQAEGVGDRDPRDRPASLLNDRLPGLTGRHLIEDVGDADPRPTKREPTLAKLGVGYDVTTEHLGHAEHASVNACE